jgi:hypothetical protein
MLNFLPEEDKRAIKKEYLRRLLVVGGIFFFASVFTGIILLSSLLLFLDNQKDNLKRQLIVSEERLLRNRVENIILSAEELNTKIFLLNSGRENIKEKSGLIKIILGEKTDEIKINNLSFGKKKISIQGESENRQALLSFTEFLKNKKDFKKIENPISNFIKDKNIEFTLTIEL